MAFFRRHSSAGDGGFLARLLRDKTGNVFAMTAAAVIPMVGVVGGAIDASRMYLVRSRLQAACDSAVLAGRKAMTTTTYDQQIARPRADAMFNFNFQDADFQTTGTAFNASADANGRLNGAAQTSIPMTLMRMFGFPTASASVTCSADIQIPNIDIVFVLDVTGSMGNSIPGGTKINALKAAAKNFYTTLKTQMDANGANAGQVRYGFVPYSQAVNAKDLFKASPDASLGELPLTHLADNIVVESRVANFTETSSTGGWVKASGNPTVIEQTFDSSKSASFAPYTASATDGTVISNRDCEDYSSNLSFSVDDDTALRVYLYPLTSWPGGADQGSSVLYIAEGSNFAQTDKPTTGNSYNEITFSRKSHNWEDKDGTKTKKYESCTRYVNSTKYVKNVAQFKFKDWTYKPVTFEVPDFKTGSTLQYATAVDSSFTAASKGPFNPVQLAAMTPSTGLSISSFTWNGCIEERDTTPATDFTPIPSEALDLNVLLGGTTDATRWRPIMDKLTYDRGKVGEVTQTGDKPVAGHNCPTTRMRNLNPMTQTAFNAYINSLSPVGSTYLDMGMVWGLRLIVPQGMFGSRNLVGPNGGQISRHIIFLTDGAMEPTTTTLSSYGVERMSRRVTGTGNINNQTALHLKRFQALCDSQRGTVNIWAIALATDVDSSLTGCADPGRAYEADDTAALNNAFASIARDIADLRLVS